MSTRYNPSIVRDSLVLCLDAANTKSYPGSGTAWKDISGEDNNSTLTNGPTFSSDNSGIIVFDGTNDYVSSLNLSSFTNLTIQMWIYDTRALSGQLDILTYNGNTSGGSYTFDTTRFRTDGNSNGGRAISLDTFNIIPQNKWYQFTYVKNGSLFINEREFSSASGSENTYGVLDIGRTRTHVNSHLNGRVSNVKVYDRGLTALEVRQNYNALKGRFGL